MHGSEGLELQAWLQRPDAFESFHSLSSVDQFNQDKQLLRDTILEEDQTDLIQQGMRLSEIYEDEEDNEDNMNISFPLHVRRKLL